MDDWHPREELSAFLDGELPEDVAERVSVHCLVCSPCASELDAARDARRNLRYLPAVEPPPGFLDALLVPRSLSRPAAPSGRTRQRTGWWIGNAAVAVTLGLLLVVASAGSPGSTAEAAMSMGDAVRHHAAATAAVSDGVDSLVAAPPRATDLGHPYVAPASLAGYRLVDAYARPGGVQLLYERGSNGLSVFETAGSAPRASEVIAGHPIEVVSRGGLVLTIVGDDASSPVRDAAEALKAARGSPSPLRRACADVLEALSPVG